MLCFGCIRYGEIVSRVWNSLYQIILCGYLHPHSYTTISSATYASDLSGNTLHGKRTGVDSNVTRFLKCYTLVLRKFIDDKEVINIHCDWTEPSTQEKIGKKTE